MDPCLHELQSKLVRNLNFLDSLVRAGETPDEIHHEVLQCAELAGFLFTGWLWEQGKDAVEVLVPTAQHLVKFVYLSEEKRAPNRATLKGITKSSLEQFLNLTDYVVSQEDWDDYLNPFDAVLLFYRFLEFTGYEANLMRRERAMKELRKIVRKKPCTVGHSTLQATH